MELAKSPIPQGLQKLSVADVQALEDAHDGQYVSVVQQSAGDQDVSIYQAAEDGNLTLVQLRLAQGADINERGGKDGETALQRAITRGQVEVARFLIGAGADVNLGRLRDGETAADMMKGNSAYSTDTMQSKLDADIERVQKEVVGD